MADALNPSKSMWEQIHGMHHVPKSYVPPFMKAEHDEMVQASSPEKVKDELYELELEEQALNKDEEPAEKPKLPRRKNFDYDNNQNLEEAPWADQDRRQIKDMRFIRIKVKQMRAEAQELISKIT
jgi:hypothetical protein